MKQKINNIDKTNNFDLIRLFAAISVVYFHTSNRLEIETNVIIHEFFKFLPGVPIFFFISGFVISLSYSRSKDLKKYIKSRILRIYPALYFCLFISICLLFLINYFNIDIFNKSNFWLWVSAQMSFAQFYNPEFLRGFGVGVLNGSLWTISVELQFYILVPTLYFFLNKISKNRNIYLFSLILLFSLINFVFLDFNDTEFNRQPFIFKIIYVSFFPWFYMFLIGIFFQENYNKIKLLLDWSFINKLLFIILCLIIYKLFDLNPITFLLLCFVIFILVFSFKNLSSNILRKNDYSYGIYIYHAVIINFFIYFDLTKDMKFLILLYIITFIFSIISWHLIEKPFLKLKG